jgi:hypothetical protein
MSTLTQLESAALAMGLFTAYFENDQANVYVSVNKRGLYRVFSPLDPTKADLLDLMLALDIDSVIGKSLVIATHGAKRHQASVINGNKHAALAEAAVSVASQIWESKNG